VLQDYRVLNAVHFGVPQDRQRLFLMGARKGQRLPDYPNATHQPQTASLDLDFVKATPTVWDALGDLPEADDYAELLERDWIETKFSKPSQYASQLREHPQNGRGDELLTSSLRTVH